MFLKYSKTMLRFINLYFLWSIWKQNKWASIKHSWFNFHHLFHLLALNYLEIEIIILFFYIYLFIFTLDDFNQVMVCVVLCLLLNFIVHIIVRTVKENMVNQSSIFVGCTFYQLPESKWIQCRKKEMRTLGVVADIEVSKNKSMIPRVNKSTKIL